MLDYGNRLKQETLYRTRIQFLTGKLESINQPIVKPLSTPFSQFRVENQNLKEGALTDVPDSPASVGFALYLIDVNTGARLWRSAFDGTQKALTEDVLAGLKNLDMGLHWLSAEELARYGV